MRIAHFVQRYPPALGGSEAYFQRLSRHLAAQGDSVTVFTTTALDLEAFWSLRGRCLPAGVEMDRDVEVHRFSLWRWPARRYLLKALSLIPQRTWQCLTMPCNPIAWDMWAEAGRAAESFDVVHATAFPYAWPIACGRRLARRLRVPFLLTPFLHLGDPEDPRDRSRRLYTAPALLSLMRAADRVFVQTNEERDALLGFGLPGEQLVLQGLGVEPAECTGGDRARARTRWGIGPHEVVVGHLANNSVEKGTVDLVRAADRAWKEGSRFHLMLAGPEMPNFRRFWDSYSRDADSPPAGSSVRRLGPLSEDEKRDFYAGIDVFALPSRSDSFGLVLLEAWANAVPCVAYRAGGVAGVVRDGQDGRLVRCGQVDELATALRELTADADLRRRMGIVGLERTAREFRWPDKLELVRRTYCEIV